MDQGRLRKVNLADMELLYIWANEETARQNSIQTHKIEPEEHKTWFLSKINSETCDMFIYQVAEVPIGQIRIDYKEQCGWISFSVDKVYRGQGHGGNMLRLAESEIKRLRPGIIQLSGFVKMDNLPSRKKFEEMQYRLKNENSEENVLLYEKQIR